MFTYLFWFAIAFCSAKVFIPIQLTCILRDYKLADKVAHNVVKEKLYVAFKLYTKSDRFCIQPYLLLSK